MPLDREIRSLRVGRAWSARELARRSGIDLSLISRFENGRRVPTVAQMDRLAATFGADPEYLHRLRVRAEVVRRFGSDPGFAEFAPLVREECAAYGVNKPVKRLGLGGEAMRSSFDSSGPENLP